MFNNIIQPGMLELGRLNISLTPSNVQCYNTATNMAMEKDHPVAQPSLAPRWGGEQDVMRSMIKPGGGVLSERCGSPEATGSPGVMQAMARWPWLLIPRTI